MSTLTTRATTARAYSKLAGSAIAALSLGACGGRVQYEEPSQPIACDYPSNIKHIDRCIDVLSNKQHCGAPDAACPQDQFCVEGTCARECGKLMPTQCGDQCVNLRTNSAHCGECGHECQGDKVCSGGVCADTCGADTPYTCGDLCVNLQTDKFHCGECGRACRDDQVCVEGRCAYDCEGTKTTECHQTCVDPRTDPRFCGGCDATCASGERCQDGTCESSCAAPTPADCSGVCADLRWDPDACGKCGVMCGPDNVCDDGQCANNCPGSREKCDDRCVDLLVDPYHCGECDNTCALDQVCSAGECEAECGGETPLRCGNRCLRLPVANGGDAGIGDGGVAPDASTDGGSVSDVGDGDCRLICPEGAPDLCPTGCVDQAIDVRHCGECGRSCGDGQVCTFGVCETVVRDGGVTLEPIAASTKSQNQSGATRSSVQASSTAGEETMGTSSVDSTRVSELALSCDGPLRFEDPEFELVVRSQLGYVEGDIYASDVLEVRDVATASQSRVTSLGGAECLTELRTLSVMFSSVSDLSPIAGLGQLTDINLRSTDVTNIAVLANLTRLTAVDLSLTDVTDLAPLSGLARLSNVSLDLTNISNLAPLNALPALEQVVLGGLSVNHLSTLSSDSLRSIEVSAGESRLLTPIILDSTAFTQFPALTTLILYGFGELQFLENIPQLESLTAEGQEVSDAGPISALLSLRDLDLSDTKISNLDALSGLTKLESLSLSDSDATDVSALATLTSLEWLDLDLTGAADLTPLLSLPSLEYLSVWEELDTLCSGRQEVLETLAERGVSITANCN